MPVRGSLTSMAMATTGCPVGQIKDANGECRWVYVPELESPPPPAPPPPPPHPSESWGTVGGGHGTPSYWDTDSDGYWTGADMEILSELGISPWAMKTYDPSYMKWQDSYNDNTISGKPYDPTLYNLDDVNAKNRNSTIQFWMDRGRPDIYSQPDLMTENLYTSLLGGVVKDGMWTREDGLLDIVGGGQVDPQ